MRDWKIGPPAILGFLLAIGWSIVPGQNISSAASATPAGRAFSHALAAGIWAKPGQAAVAGDPRAALQRALQTLEAARTNFRKTGDVKSMVPDVRRAQAEAQSAYQQFTAHSEYAAAAQSLIALGDIERMLLVMEDPERMQAGQDRINQQYRDALNLATRAGDLLLQYKAVAGLVRTDLNTKNYAAAIGHADQLVALATKAGHNEDLVNAYDTRAQVNSQRGDFSAANDDLTRALVLKDQVKDQFLLWSLYDDRSDLYNNRAAPARCSFERDTDFCMKTLATAIEDSQHAVDVAQQAGLAYLAGQSQTRINGMKLLQKLQMNLAPGYAKLSDSTFRITKASQVVVLPHFVGLRDPQMAAQIRAVERQYSGPVGDFLPMKYYTEGFLLEKEGDNEGALRNYDKAVSLLEGDRRKLGDDQTGSSYLDDQIEIYYAPAMQYLDRQQFAKAFELLEASRSRSMADLLNSRQLVLNNPQDQELFSESVELKARLAKAQSDLFNLSGSGKIDEDRIRQLQARIDDLQGQTKVLNDKITQQAPKLDELTGENSPVTLESLRALARQNNFDVLYYLSVKSGLIIWHIGGDSQQAVKVYYTPPLVTMRVNALSRSLSDPNLAFDDDDAKELYLVLINPVLKDIKTRHLVIIPHEDLSKLPFQVLKDPSDGAYLADHFQISYAPSATVLSKLTGRPDFAHGHLLAMGDPDIDKAATEVKAIGKIYAGRSKVVADVIPSKQDVKTQTGGSYNLVHLAVHGVFDSKDPLLSYLILRHTPTDDGHFTAAEMFGLHLPKNSLVVLSACETGRAEVSHSNEVLGMVRGLLYAGASNLVLSSWKVDSEATALWMETFYREAQSKPASEAAQLALLSVKKVPRFQHPFYWAPFLLTGQ